MLSTIDQRIGTAKTLQKNKPGMFHKHNLCRLAEDSFCLVVLLQSQHPDSWTIKMPPALLLQAHPFGWPPSIREEKAKSHFFSLFL